MKRLSFASGLLLALAVSPVMAEGVSLRWQDCEGDGGVQNRTFACDTNSGSHVLAASFTLDFDMHGVLGDELVLDYFTSSPTLAPWWQIRSNSFHEFTACRDGAISIAVQDGASCPDLFAPQAPVTSMNVAGLVPFIQGMPNTARLLSINAVPATNPVDLILADNSAGNATWGVARWTISNIQTVGTGACAGCLTPACFVLQSCNIVTVDNTDNRKLDFEASAGSNFVSWQSASGDCPGAVPTRKSTWGAVKSLYR